MESRRSKVSSTYHSCIALTRFQPDLRTPRSHHLTVTTTRLQLVLCLHGNCSRNWGALTCSCSMQYRTNGSCVYGASRHGRAEVRLTGLGRNPQQWASRSPPWRWQLSSLPLLLLRFENNHPANGAGHGSDVQVYMITSIYTPFQTI